MTAIADFKAIVSKQMGVNIDHECNDWIDNTTGGFEKDDLKSNLTDVLDGLVNDPFLFNKALETLIDNMAASAITRRSNIKLFKDGNPDYLAFNSMVVSRKGGGYILLQHADIDTIKLKMEAQETNYDAVVAKKEQFKDVVIPVMEYMFSHGIDEFGKAVSLMGLDA